MIDKALAGDADAVVLDLEDSVPPDRKPAARANAAAVLRGIPSKPMYVRINSQFSGLAIDDIVAIAGPHLTGIRIPKAQDPADIRAIEKLLAKMACDACLVPLIESALGVERAFEIAAISDTVLTLAMGEADLRSDLRASADNALDYARSRCVTAARAARRAPAIQSVHTRIRDAEDLQRSTERGKALGFGGRSAIHPAQIRIINAVFTPSEAEYAHALAILAAYDQACARGEVATTTPDGEFVDAPVASDAAAVVALAALPRT